MQKIKRVWHPYYLWEEISHNMWGSVNDVKSMVGKAIEFTGDHKLYGSYMQRVISEWPVSCENALTDYNMNRKAWIGHAACAMALSCPEHITRKAWKELSFEQQHLANQEASRAIRAWENNYIENTELHKDMGESMLPGWDS